VKKKLLLISLAVVLALSFGVVGCTTEPPPEITLTYGSLYGSTHTFSKADIAWMDKIEADTDGQVKFEVYWGSTLISRTESCAELVAGVADLAYIGPGYSAAGYDIDKAVLAWYYGVPSYDARRWLHLAIWSQFPEYRAEFANMKIMCTAVSSTYQLLSNTPVRTLDDLAGLRIKATGSFIDLINALGGEGISLPMGEVYSSLQKNDIQGALVPYSTIQEFSFHEVAKYMTILDLTSGCRPARAMNLDSYNSLPEEFQQLFDDSITFWEEEDDLYRANDDITGKELGEQEGMEFIELPTEELDYIYDQLDPIMREVAAGLDDQGLPGTDIYEKIRQLIDQQAWAD